MYLEHEPDLVPFAAFILGVKAEQILKTRGTPDGGLVVIDANGAKRVFDGETVRQAMEYQHAGKRGKRPVFETTSEKEDKAWREAQKKQSAKREKRRAAAAEDEADGDE